MRPHFRFRNLSPTANLKDRTIATSITFIKMDQSTINPTLFSTIASETLQIEGRQQAMKLRKPFVVTID
jgi:hypothetical protein